MRISDRGLLIEWWTKIMEPIQDVPKMPGNTNCCALGDFPNNGLPSESDLFRDDETVGAARGRRQFTPFNEACPCRFAPDDGNGPLTSNTGAIRIATPDNSNIDRLDAWKGRGMCPVALKVDRRWKRQ